MQIDMDKCTACGACNNICPTNAIKMKMNNNGFFYPYVELDMCINCGQCEKVCPVSNDNILRREININEPVVYAMQSSDEELRLKSTSGGAFSELARIVLDYGGYVVGAAYRKDWSVEHQMIHEKIELESLRRSKYQQSDMGGILKKIKDKLTQGDKVLFCGTPCQNAGLKMYLGDECENLYLVDFICRGVPSPGLFQEYLKSLEEKFESNATSVWMKNKRNGWHSLSTVIKFASGEEYVKAGFDDSYVQLFLKYNIGIRASCYRCSFKNKMSVADITLGDFWGLDGTELDDNKGTSTVICRTHKGLQLVKEILHQNKVKKMCMEDVKRGNPCLENSVQPGLIEEYKFFDILQQTGYNEAVKWVERITAERNSGNEE